MLTHSVAFHIFILLVSSQSLGLKLAFVSNLFSVHGTGGGGVWGQQFGLLYNLLINIF